VKYLQHLQVGKCWVTMHGGNGCIDALLTHNFKPCCVNMSIGLHHKYYLLDCR